METTAKVSKVKYIISFSFFIVFLVWFMSAVDSIKDVTGNSNTSISNSKLQAFSANGNAQMNLFNSTGNVSVTGGNVLVSAQDIKSFTYNLSIPLSLCIVSLNVFINLLLTNSRSMSKKKQKR